MLTKRNIYAWLEISRASYQNTQVIDLMLMYMKDFDDIMKKIREIEKRHQRSLATELITHRKVFSLILTKIITQMKG